MSSQDQNNNSIDENIQETAPLKKEAPESMSFLDRIPSAACLVGQDDAVIYANNQMASVFTYSNIEDSNFFALTGVRRKELLDALGAPESSQPIIERSDKYFELHTDGDATLDGEMVDRKSVV